LRKSCLPDRTESPLDVILSAAKDLFLYRLAHTAQDRLREGSDGEAVVPSEARDLYSESERSFVATLLRTTDPSSLRSSE